jgi:hypothetical protein
MIKNLRLTLPTIKFHFKFLKELVIWDTTTGLVLPFFNNHVLNYRHITGKKKDFTRLEWDRGEDESNNYPNPKSHA